MKKKQYENIFAKICEHHNNESVPVLRSLNLSTVKVKNRIIVSLRDTLEHSENVIMSIDLLTEYIVTNTFFLKLLSEEDLDTCYSLIKTRAKENIVISANLVYNLIEAKKKEILNLMKNGNELNNK